MEPEMFTISGLKAEITVTKTVATLRIPKLHLVLSETIDKNFIKSRSILLARARATLYKLGYA